MSMTQSTHTILQRILVTFEVPEGWTRAEQDLAFDALVSADIYAAVHDAIQKQLKTRPMIRTLNVRVEDF